MPDTGRELATIEFVGELTIQNVGEARERLLGAFEQATSVVADIQSDATVDLSFLQLIESARRTADARFAAFDLARPADGQLRQALERGGFLAAPGQREFWLMQSEGR